MNAMVPLKKVCCRVDMMLEETDGKEVNEEEVRSSSDKEQHT